MRKYIARKRFRGSEASATPPELASSAGLTCGKTERRLTHKNNAPADRAGHGTTRAVRLKTYGYPPNRLFR